MKIKNILYCGVAALLMASCAEQEWDDITVEKPDTGGISQELEAYAPLKSYIDRSAHPGFKLGTGILASEYNLLGFVYKTVNENFDEITAGNAMKYASCVNARGRMDFSTVKKFIANAEMAGISVYGHTLMWHSQQQNNYLNGLVELPPVGGSANNYVVITNPTADGFWNAQCFVGIGTSLSAGKTYSVSMRAKATGSATIRLWLAVGTGWGADCEDNGPSFSVSTSWETCTVEITPTKDIDNLKLVFGDFAGDICFDDIQVVEKGTNKNLFKNSTCDVIDNWVNGYGHAYTIALGMDGATEVEQDLFSTDFVNGPSLGGWGGGSTMGVVNGVFEINNPSKTNSWGVQVNCEPVGGFTEGETYYLELKIKGSADGSITAGLQNPDGYIGCGDFSPAIDFTTDWQTITCSATCNGAGARRLLLNVGAFEGTIYIDSYRVYQKVLVGGSSETDEERAEREQRNHDALAAELYRWIDGMMEACDGKVTSWDAVNEVMAGSDSDGDGVFEPWNENNTDDDFKTNNFIWRTYLGDLDVVRLPFQYARELFAKHNGDASQLKLFINDYNLESNWDNNAKAKAYLHWIPIWESDGITKIDGWATQMHISCYENAQTQESKKAHIKKMFELMASSGKLIRVSELDMAYVDINGNTVKAVDLTEDQQKLQAELYQWVVETYFETIPVEQQYGICHWSPTDSPEGSGWRAGEAIGLWTLGWERKWAYAGFAEGLKK